MAPRRYEMGKRARAAAETRQRIVEATYALHGEQGVAETTMKQIAMRAGVGLGTVYHHFPTYDDAVRVCGAYAFETAMPPTAEVFEDAVGLSDRVARLVGALFAFYGRCPSLAKARADQHRIKALDEAMTAWDSSLGELVAAALRPLGRSRRRDAVAAGLLDYEVYRRLTGRGLSPAEAADSIAGVLLAWLQTISGGGGDTRRTKRRRSS